jgi:diguanylate cyclase (GGDEF)-like protein
MGSVGRIAVAVVQRFDWSVDLADPRPAELFAKMVGIFGFRHDNSFEHYLRHHMIGFGNLSDGRWEAHSAVREWGRVCSIDDAAELVMFGRKVACDHEWGALQRATNVYQAYLEDIQNQMGQHLSGEQDGYFTTPELILRHRTTLVSLRDAPRFPNNFLTYDDHRDVAVLACRLRMASLRSRREELERLARSRDVMRGIEQELGYLEAFLSSPELQDRRDVAKPRLTDFVNIGIIEQHRSSRPTDEKFGILTAPGQFAADYADACEGAFSRGRSLVVGFIDIDNFKTINQKYKETVVDRDILPTFMRELEAYCYRRGYAYRQGGDEYLVLLHNATAVEAEHFFAGLHQHLAEIHYPPTIEANPTVSIGYHVIDGNDEVTVFEAQRRANEAKDAAKAAGRNTTRAWIRT